MDSRERQTGVRVNRPAPSSFFASRRAPLLGGAVIAAAGVAAYANSFSGAFVFLDVSAILENPTIRHLWPLGPVLAPPADGGLTVGGRPLVNLSLAANYAISGTHVWSYHALNLLIHILAGLALFGIVRRTLEPVGTGGPPVRAAAESKADADGRAARPYRVAFVVALLWTLHPLQTESVTYVIQRAESLMGLFYLLTLYCFIRGVGEEAGGKIWFSLSVGCCLLGMATKEVMVSAPVIVFLYDRTFVSGSFGEAWRKRWRLYLALAATWILLGGLVMGTGGNRGGTSGFGLGISWWTYARTQFPAILHYLRLALWPRPLVFYYPVQWTLPMAIVGPCGVAIAALAVGSVWAFFRRGGEGRAVGFLGLWFFAVLAPTSLVPGMSQTLAEHRMYLALAPLIVAGVLAVQRGLGSRGLCLLLALAAAFGFMTARRNLNYRNELVLWSDTVAKSPNNPYVQSNLGLALAGAGRAPEAIDHFTQALQLNPAYPEAQNNLGLAIASLGRLPEAVGHYEKALQLKPAYPEAQSNLGVALADLGRFDEAIVHFRAALQLKPNYTDARNDLAVALASTGRTAEAIVQYREVLRADPRQADTHYNLGNALVQAGRMPEAIVEYQEALRLNPNNPEAHANLGALLANGSRLPEAVAQYQQALALTPNDPDVHYNLGLALRTMGQEQAAAAQFSDAARLRKP
jgi:tetratricopeptide (TPR) repeat protein